MSDWIASNEHFFPLLSLDETDVKTRVNVLKLGLKSGKNLTCGNLKLSLTLLLFIRKDLDLVHEIFS